nr:MAG TPA: hypothetical protein [Caudoviricetes sp.]
MYISICSIYMYIIYRIKVTFVIYRFNLYLYCILGITFNCYISLPTLHLMLHNR